MPSNLDQPFSLIHLLCDFGVESPDYTVAMARMANHFPKNRCVISPQSFKKGHIMGQSIFLKLVVPEFPTGSIHVCRVGTLSKMPARFVIAKHLGSFFLAPDNGLLPLYFGDEKIKYFNITPTGIDVTDPLNQVFIPALKQLFNSDFELASNFPVKEMIAIATAPSPTVSNDVVGLTVVYNDYYGNAYLNVDRKSFDLLCNNRNFKLMLSSTMSINRISNSYNDVTEGLELCLFGYGDIMQIAVNAGSAVQYLGLSEGRNVLLKFDS